jgi:hypothetical protein
MAATPQRRRQEDSMKPFTATAVALLGLVALVHVVRLLAGFEVVIAGFSMPVWASLPGALVAGGLAMMVRRESRG